MIPSILVQQQHHVVLQRRIAQSTQQMDASFRRNIGVLQNSADKRKEIVAQRPRALALNQILVQFLDGVLLLFGQLSVNELYKRFEFRLGLYIKKKWYN